MKEAIIKYDTGYLHDGHKLSAPSFEDRIKNLQKRKAEYKAAYKSGAYYKIDKCVYYECIRALDNRIAEIEFDRLAAVCGGCEDEI